MHNGIECVCVCGNAGTKSISMRIENWKRRLLHSSPLLLHCQRFIWFGTRYIFCLFRCWIWEIGFFWCRCWCCCYLVCTGCRTRLLMTKLSRWPIVTYPQWIAPVCVCVQCAHRIVPFFFKQQTATTTTNFWWNALIRNKSSKKSFTFSLPRHRFILYFIFSLFHSPHSVQLTSLIFLFFPPQCRFVKVCCCVCVLFLFLSRSFLLIEAYSKIRKWANSYDTC